MKTFLFILEFFFMNCIIFSQAPDTLWTRTVSLYSERNIAYSVVESSDNGYVLTGRTEDINSNSDVFLIKFDTNGELAWEHFWGTNYEECGYSLQQTSDGGFIITGNSAYSRLLLKTDSEGDSLWMKSIHIPGGLQCGYSVQQTDDGGYITIGATAQYNYGNVLLMKTNGKGDTLWTEQIPEGINGIGRCIQKTSDGGFILTGIKTIDDSNCDIFLVKTDSFCNVQWEKTFGGESADWGLWVEQTNDNGYIIVAKSATYDPAYQFYHDDALLIKTNSVGDTLWSKTYGGLGFDVAYSVQQTKDGGYILGGETWSFSGAGDPSDAWIIKTDSNGDTLWTKSIGKDNLEDIGRFVRQTSDGGYILVGGTISSNPDVGYEAWLVKIAPDINSVDTEHNSLPDKFKLYQNYPNPFNPSTTIKYTIANVGSRHASTVQLKIYNILGQEVATLVNKQQKPGNYEVIFHANGLPSGTYFYKLTVGDFSETKKLLLLK